MRKTDFDKWVKKLVEVTCAGPHQLYMEPGTHRSCKDLLSKENFIISMANSFMCCVNNALKNEGKVKVFAVFSI